MTNSIDFRPKPRHVHQPWPGDPEAWVLTLKPLPGWNRPGVVRLRSALKMFLRMFGLACTEIRPHVEQEHDFPVAELVGSVGKSFTNENPGKTLPTVYGEGS